MYARHLAWLNATPEKAKKSRKDSLSFGGESPLLTMPDLGDYEYIVSFWHEAGTFMSGASGIYPLTWEEIKSYADTLSLDLSNWELSSIKRLSAEYCGEYHQASDKTRPAPFTVAEEEIDRVAVANKIKNVLSGFKRKKETPKYEVE